MWSVVYIAGQASESSQTAMTKMDVANLLLIIFQCEGSDESSY